MFRSQTNHHQGDTIFLLTSVTKFNILMYQHACCNVCVRSCLILLLLCRSGYDLFDLPICFDCIILVLWQHVLLCKGMLLRVTN